MNRTKIEWAKNPDGTPGYTWNPITGCLNHDNGLCKGGGFPCYAYRLAHGRLRERYLRNVDIPQIWSNKGLSENSPYLDDAFYPRFWSERFGILPLVPPSKPKGIFVCDMGELFGDWIPLEWQERVFQTIRTHWQHRFYLLTKQPQNLSKWSPFPENCWVGVTACNYTMANQARYWLGEIEAKVKYLSIEPLMEPLVDRHGCQFQFDSRFNQVILGAQTKPYKPPKIEWVQEIVGAADRAGIPVFLKDNLKPMFGIMGPKEATELPSELVTHIEYINETQLKVSQLRQEMPRKEGRLEHIGKTLGKFRNE